MNLVQMPGGGELEYDRLRVTVTPQRIGPYAVTPLGFLYPCDGCKAAVACKVDDSGWPGCSLSGAGPVQRGWRIHGGAGFSLCVCMECAREMGRRLLQS